MNYYYVVFLVITVLCSSLVDAAGHWSYRSEDNWPAKCLQGKKQSPINLQKDTAEEYSFTDLHFRKYDIRYNASIKNTGHSVAVNLVYPRHYGPSISGGGLPYEYVLDHLHFHWESEHTLHNNRFPLELHFVHYANIYDSVKTALERNENNNGLAVLGVLFDFSEEDNPAFEPILEKLHSIRDFRSNAVTLDQDSVRPSDFLPKDIYTFFRYEGSLTTPTCDETVVWTVFYRHNFISKKQFEEFRKISAPEGPLTENYRSLQNLNGRVVAFRNFASVNKFSCSCIIAFMIFYVCMFINNIFL